MFNISRIYNLLNFTLVSFFPPNVQSPVTGLMHYSIYSLLPFTPSILPIKGDNRRLILPQTQETMLTSDGLLTFSTALREKEVLHVIDIYLKTAKVRGRLWGKPRH